MLKLYIPSGYPVYILVRYNFPSLLEETIILLSDIFYYKHVTSLLCESIYFLTFKLFILVISKIVIIEVVLHNIYYVFPINFPTVIVCDDNFTE